MKIVDAEPREGFQIWVRFEDGATGNIDLGDSVGRGVFRVWEDRGVFDSLHVSDVGAVEWPGDVDLCSDALYMRLTGKQSVDLFPALRAVQSDAGNLPILRHHYPNVLC